MPDTHEAHDHAHAAQAAPIPPCQCEQEHQFGNALPLILVGLAVMMALDRWSRWRSKKNRISHGGGSDN